MVWKKSLASFSTWKNRYSCRFFAVGDYWPKVGHVTWRDSSQHNSMIEWWGRDDLAYLRCFAASRFWVYSVHVYMWLFLSHLIWQVQLNYSLNLTNYFIFFLLLYWIKQFIENPVAKETESLRELLLASKYQFQIASFSEIKGYILLQDIILL